MQWALSNGKAQKKTKNKHTNNKKNKPDQATMRPDCISVRSDFGTRFGLTDR